MWHLSAFSADSPGQLDVLRHDGHAFSVDRAQVGILKQTNQIGLGRFLLKIKNHNWRKKCYFYKFPKPNNTQALTWRAPIAADWNRRSVLKSWAISRTNRWKGSLRIRSSVDFWYLWETKYITLWIGLYWQLRARTWINPRNKTFWFLWEPRYRDGNDVASSRLRLTVRSSWQPWWRAAYEAPCLR